MSTEDQVPPPTNTEPNNFFSQLRAALQASNSYAWSWQCNLAMSFFDAVPAGQKPNNLHRFANEGAARIMRNFFDVDVTQFPEYKSLQAQWAEVQDGDLQIPEYVEIGEYRGVDLTRYTMGWKSIVDVGMVLTGAPLFAIRKDVDAWRKAVEESANQPVIEQTPAPDELPMEEQEPASTVMDKDRLDSAT